MFTKKNLMGAAVAAVLASTAGTASASDVPWFDSSHCYGGSPASSSTVPTKTVTKSDGSTYEVSEGYGTVTYSDGSLYKGYFKDGQRHGHGVYTWPSGDRYEGAFAYGCRHGYGTETYPNGDRYEGDWDKNDITGFGTAYWTDGTSYVGMFLNGYYQGFGTVTYANGDSYSGEYAVGKPNGYGTAYFASNGSTYAGLWYSGCFDDGSKKAAWGASAAECGFNTAAW